MRHPPTLSQLVGLYAGGGLFVLALLFGLTLQQSLNRFLEGSLHDKAGALAEQLAILSLDAVLVRDYASLENSIQQLAKGHDVLFVRIRRADGNLLGEAGLPPPEEGHRIMAVRPILLLGNPLGEVTVALDTGMLSALQRHFVVTGLFGIAVVTLLLFLITQRLLRRRLIAPLRDLAQQVSPLHKRADDVRAGADQPREIVQIATTFAHLRGEIDDHLTRLEQANRLTRAATERLCREQRLATVGQLAAGLAHGLNTPLGNIVGYAQLSRRNSDDPQLCERMAIIEKQANACSTIVRNLLTVAHRPDPVGQHLDLHELTAGTVQLIRPLLYDRGVDRIELDGKPPCPAWADPSTFEQVLFNLFSNAAQAGATRLHLSLQCNANGSKLIFEDNGPGIPAALHDELFEPFLTTKPAGEGTGLGLYLCRSLLQAMGGTITLLSSQPGATRFCIHLPHHGGGESL